jgi:hypothetical protein
MFWIGRIINKIKNTNEQELFMEKNNGKVRRERKPSASRAEEGYCSETSQSGQSSHSPKHAKNYWCKTKNGLDKETHVNKGTCTELQALSKPKKHIGKHDIKELQNTTYWAQHKYVDFSNC